MYNSQGETVIQMLELVMVTCVRVQQPQDTILIACPYMTPAIEQDVKHYGFLTSICTINT